MARIKNDDYNKARSILAQAGSQSASKAHPQHSKQGDCPESYGRSLLQEARAEFQTEAGQGNGLNPLHEQALNKAGKAMGL